VVIIHDESVDRVTGGAGLVRDFSFDELRRFNASAAVYGERFGFNPIPSLDEYLQWVKGAGLVTNIELKNSVFCYEGLEEKTLALVKKHGLEERVLFSSFNHLSLVKCKKLCPSIPCGVLTGRHIGNAGFYIRSAGLDFYHPEMSFLSADIVRDCENHGVGINVWTVNDMGGLIRAEELGCRGIITNFPHTARLWLGRSGADRVAG
jgi:glycerophosphoryl diester phosphodiesterase